MRSLSVLFCFPLLLAISQAAAPRQSSSSSSSFATAIENLQKRIGYEFKGVYLLRRAMTHPSYSVGENCRSLGILGLSVAQTASSLRLLQADVDASADALNRRLSQITALQDCAASGAELGLERVVRVSARTNSSAPSVVCCAYRAIFGAVAVDSAKADTAGDVFWKLHEPAATSAAI